MFIQKVSSRSLRFVMMTVAALMISAGAMWAQNVNVKGTVTDEAGQPLPGVYVLVQGTTNGTATDIDGAYSLSVPSDGTLVYSLMGMRDATVPVNNRSVINVTMQEDAELLDEAIVVGFGTQKKENLTGAVASVNAEEALASRPIADVSRGLQGMVAGMTVQVGDGEVGSATRIRIRGQIGSEQGGASPLILLDNVEIPSISMVNPEDIASISVLKDAASASIYGAKAAFGVVLITTKKGTGSDQESVTVNYSGNLSFNSMAKDYNMADVDALHYTVEAAERVGTYTPVGAFWLIDRAGYNAAVAWKQKYKDLSPNAPFTYGRDWYVDNSGRKIGVRTFDPYDYMIKENRPSHSHNLSIAGRKGNTDFNITLGYLDQEGLVKPAENDDYRRWNANVRVSTKLNDWVSVRAGIMYSKEQKRWAYASSSTSADVWLYTYRWGPTFPMVSTDEYGNRLRNSPNELENANTAYNSYSYTSTTAGLTITPLKNWNIDFDYTYAVRDETAWRPGTVHTGGDTWVAPNPVAGATVANEWAEYNLLGSNIPAYVLNVYDYGNSSSSYDHVYRSGYTSQRQTYILKSTYEWNFLEDHTFNFMLGFQAVDYQNEGSWSRKYTLLDYANPQFDLAIGSQFAGGGHEWESQAGVFGRINYNYKNKYLVEANLRYDGSSKFPTDLKWRWFPSFSAGWVVSEEPWMKGISNVLSFLKVRGSWGKIGDQTVANSLYIPTMTFTESSWIENGAKFNYYTTPGAVRPDITWQDIVTLDVGVDARLFRDLGITFDWYSRKTENMIVPGAGIGYNFGASAPMGNFGSLKTNGWELTLDYGHMFSNGFSLAVTASISDAKTTIDEYGTGRSIDNWYNGKTYGEIWGYRVDRLFQNDDFAYDNNGNLIRVESSDGYSVNQFKDPNMPTQGYLNSGNLVFGPGDMKYKDVNGDGVINDGQRTVEDHGDLEVIGNSTPRYEYSFRVDMAYKGFDLSLFLQGVGKRDLWNASFLGIPGYNSSDGSMPQTFAGDFWYETFDAEGNVIDANYDAYYPRAANMGGGSGFNTVCNDRLLLNMAYLRLKNVTLGYTLPQHITKKAYINKLRVYVSLENFLTFDKLNGLPIDPEAIPGVSYFDSSNYNLGRIGNGVPAMKTASVGLQITF